jgi:hypothetical protein
MTSFSSDGSFSRQGSGCNAEKAVGLRETRKSRRRQRPPSSRGSLSLPLPPSLARLLAEARRLDAPQDLPKMSRSQGHALSSARKIVAPWRTGQFEGLRTRQMYLAAGLTVLKHYDVASVHFLLCSFETAEAASAAASASASAASTDTLSLGFI